MSEVAMRAGTPEPMAALRRESWILVACSLGLSLATALIALGDGHTFLLSETSEDGGLVVLGSLETEIEGVTVLDWFTAMMNGTEGWDNLVDPDIE